MAGQSRGGFLCHDGGISLEGCMVLQMLRRTDSCPSTSMIPVTHCQATDLDVVDLVLFGASILLVRKDHPKLSKKRPSENVG